MNPKLRLKRTPAEEEQRARHKAYKAAKKAAKRKHSDDRETGTSSRRKKYSNIDDNDLFGQSSSSHKPDYDAIRAELEDMRFKERLWGALEEDERLDGINARFNDYAHIPDRWARDQHNLANPQYMDDDEYAEWVREGMWKKKHVQEYEEQAKREAERTAQRAREKEIRENTRRLEKLALQREERRRKERQRQREEEHRHQYELRWKTLLDSRAQDHRPLTFQDIPWPLFSVQFVERKATDSSSPLVEHITPDAISAFLLSEDGNIDASITSGEISRRNRDKLKEALLRFHPDKFEGRLMHRVLARDVESVREAVGQVARTLNALMNKKSP